MTKITAKPKPNSINTRFIPPIPPIKLLPSRKIGMLVSEQKSYLP